MTNPSILDWCYYVPFQTIEAVLYPLNALMWVMIVFLSLGSITALGFGMEFEPSAGRQLELPGFERSLATSRDTSERRIEWIFWALVGIVGCGAVTDVVVLLSWIVYTHLYCPSAIP